MDAHSGKKQRKEAMSKSDNIVYDTSITDVKSNYDLTHWLQDLHDKRSVITQLPSANGKCEGQQNRLA